MDAMYRGCIKGKVDDPGQNKGSRGTRPLGHIFAAWLTRYTYGAELKIMEFHEFHDFMNFAHWAPVPPVPNEIAAPVGHFFVSFAFRALPRGPLYIISWIPAPCSCPGSWGSCTQPEYHGFRLRAAAPAAGAAARSRNP